MKQGDFIIKEDAGLSSKCKTAAQFDLALDAIQVRFRSEFFPWRRLF